MAKYKKDLMDVMRQVRLSAILMTASQNVKHYTVAQLWNLIKRWLSLKACRIKVL